MKSSQATATKYYKYGKLLNGKLVGSPSFSNGILSSITRANYATSAITLTETVNTFEVRTKIVTQTTGTAYAKVLSVATSEISVKYFKNIVIQAGNDSKKLELLFWNDNTYKGAWAVNNYNAGTTYWLKWIYDGNDIKGYYSTDGTNYTLGSTTDAADRAYFRAAINKFTSCNMQIGTGTQESGALADNQTFSTGSVDLTKTQIIVNNKTIWSGTFAEPAKSSSYDYTVQGVQCKLIKNEGTKYYKYASWTQPVLTNNRSSVEMWLEDPALTGAKNNSAQSEIETWGTSTMSTFNNVYLAMDSNTTNVFTLSASNVAQDQWMYQIYNVFDICFSQKMKVSHIKVVCQFQSGYHCALRRAMIYAVNDNLTLGSRLMNVAGSNSVTTLEADIGTNLQRRLRVCLRPDWNNNSYSCQIKEVTVTAQKVINGTSSSYDYTETIQQYKAFNL